MPPHPAYCFDSTENKVLDLLIYKLGKAKEGRKEVMRGAGIPSGLSLAHSSGLALKTDGSNLRGIKCTILN